MLGCARVYIGFRLFRHFVSATHGADSLLARS